MRVDWIFETQKKRKKRKRRHSTHDDEVWLAEHDVVWDSNAWPGFNPDPKI
jgi:hypothetical protein